MVTGGAETEHDFSANPARLRSVKRAGRNIFRVALAGEIRIHSY
jgi:hypothetical protein